MFKCFSKSEQNPTLTQDLLPEQHSEHSQVQIEHSSRLFVQLVNVAGSSFPFDFAVSFAAFLMSLVLFKELPEDDAPVVLQMTVAASNIFRIIFQGFVLPAFAHQGLQFCDSNKLTSIDQTEFSSSMAALLKIGSLSAVCAAAFLSVTPFIYGLTGVSPRLVKESYGYVAIAIPALILQIVNFGLQQTLVTMAKKTRMIYSALIQMVCNVLPLLLLLILGNPLSSVSTLIEIPAITLFANIVLFLTNMSYFYHKNVLLSPYNYASELYQEKIASQFKTFRNIGFSIFLQLLSELGILYIQPFLVLLVAVLSNSDKDSVLTQLGAAGVLNLFTIIFAITFSIAAGNAVSAQTNQLKVNNDDDVYYTNIRSIIKQSVAVMLVLSVVLFGGLTTIAPYITNLFYREGDIDAGPLSNPYMFMSVIAVGTILDYLRNLALFILRSFNINTYGTFSSYLCLWGVNIPLIVMVSYLYKDAGVFAILIPYYVSIATGAAMLWSQLFKCTYNNEVMQLLVLEDPDTLKQHEFSWPSCCHNQHGLFGRDSETRRSSGGFSLPEVEEEHTEEAEEKRAEENLYSISHDV